MRAALLLVSLGACGFSINTGTSIDASGSDSAGGSDGDIIDSPSTIDAMPDMMTTNNNWTTPASLGISGGSNPTLTGDLLQIWYTQNGDIYHAVRGSIFTGFGPPAKETELSLASSEATPEIDVDGRNITFARLIGNNDLYIASWNVNLLSWNAPLPINDLNTQDHEQSASISADRTMMAFTRNAAAATADIYFSTRSSPSDAWGTPTAATELNSQSQDGNVFLLGNKLTVCFDSLRGGTTSDIYCASRTSAAQPFDTPVAMTEINSSANDQEPWMAPNGSAIIFWSDRDGTGRFYYSLRQ